MPAGTFKHTSIGAATPKPSKCTVGWIAHYLIGITFAITFVAFMGSSWLRQPTLAPAFIFGIVTVLAPFFTMQPLMGLGFAASKAPNPTQARLRSLMNHMAFGAGLYFFAWLINGLMEAFA